MKILSNINVQKILLLDVNIKKIKMNVYNVKRDFIWLFNILMVKRFLNVYLNQTESNKIMEIVSHGI